MYANRRRPRGRRLQRLRGERLERPNAHLYETGRLRRVHLWGHSNIRKRLLVHACSLNLGLLTRHLTGVGIAAQPPGPRTRPLRHLGTRLEMLLEPRIAS